jgi:hypothetical protein
MWHLNLVLKLYIQTLHHHTVLHVQNGINPGKADLIVAGIFCLLDSMTDQ